MPPADTVKVFLLAPPSACGQARRRLKSAPRIVLAGDEVDDAAHGVGAVDGGSAVFQHFHALDGAGGDVVQVHTRVVTGAEAKLAKRRPFSSTRVLDTPKPRKLAPVKPRWLPSGVGDGWRRRSARPRWRSACCSSSAAVVTPSLVDVGTLDHLHRQGGFAVDALDAGAGDLHAVQLSEVVSPLARTRQRRPRKWPGPARLAWAKTAQAERGVDKWAWRGEVQQWRYEWTGL